MKRAIGQTQIEQQQNILFKKGTGYKFTENEDGTFTVQDDMLAYHTFTAEEFQENFEVEEYEVEMLGYGARNTFNGN